MRQTDGEIVAFSDANCTWSPDSLRLLVARLRRSGGRLHLRAAAHSRRGRRQPGRRLLELRDEAARRRVAARLGHRGKRIDLRRAARRLRRGRSALRPRSLAPVPAGPGRTPRGVRARRPRLGEADALERDRIPAQGAHVRALLADRPPRQDVPSAAGRSTCSRSSRTGCCATGQESSMRAARHLARAVSPRLVLRRGPGCATGRCSPPPWSV